MSSSVNKTFFIQSVIDSGNKCISNFVPVRLNMTDLIRSFYHYEIARKTVKILIKNNVLSSKWIYVLDLLHIFAHLNEKLRKFFSPFVIYDPQSEKRPNSIFTKTKKRWIVMFLCAKRLASMSHTHEYKYLLLEYLFV